MSLDAKLWRITHGTQRRSLHEDILRELIFSEQDVYITYTNGQIKITSDHIANPTLKLTCDSKRWYITNESEKRLISIDITYPLGNNYILELAQSYEN